jgi:hypothetical protein
VRYDVEINLKLKHVLAVEAGSAFEAQAKALEAMADRDPEVLSTEFEINRSKLD